VPVYSVRVCSGVCYEEFGSVYENIILQGLVAHTFYPLIYAGCVYIASEDPENLEFGIVLKEIFREVAGIAAVLLESICPAHHPSFMYACKTSDDE
jgi:hypothetical protein